MIFVNVSDSNSRYGQQMVNEATDTPRSLFEKLGVAYERGQTSINGRILNGAQIDETFANLGVSGQCTLTNIIKGDGAAC